MIALIKRLIKNISASKVVKNIGIYIGGNIIHQVGQVILIPIWSVFLTPEDYGITGQVTVYSSVLSFLMGLGLQTAINRFYFDYKDGHIDQKRLITSLVLFQVCFSIVLSIILSIIGHLYWDPYSHTTIVFKPYMLISIWMACLKSWTITLIYLYQVEQKAKKFVSLNLLQFLLYVIGMFIFVVWLRMGAYGQLMGSLLSTLVAGIFLMVLFMKRWFISAFNIHTIKRGLLYGLPMVPNSIFSWAIIAADRVILDRFITLTEIGYYNFAYSIGSILMAIDTAVVNAWMPHYFRMMSEEEHPEKKIVKFFFTYLLILSLASVLGSLFIKDLVAFFFPDRYLPGAVYIPPLLTATIYSAMYTLGSGPLLYYKKTNIVAIINGCAAAFNIALNIWLIPIYGAIASAWITTATYLVLAILSLSFGSRYQRLNAPYVRFILLSSVPLLYAAIQGYLGYLDFPSFIIKILLLLFYVLLVYLIFVIPNKFDKTLKYFFKTKE